MTEPTLLSRFQGCLMGVRLGDAMGMPWETMTRKQILKKTDGKGVTGFVDPQQRSSHDTAHFKAGDTTDDWQLTEAVAESLIRKRGFDFEDMARAHVDAYHSSVAGWGATTKKAMEEFDLWKTTMAALGRDPSEPAVNDSRGNGVAMKIAPYALLYHPEIMEIDCWFDEEIEQLGRMTHGDPLATQTAYGLARAIHYVSDDWVDADRILRLMHKEIDGIEEDSNRLIRKSFANRLWQLSDGDLTYAPIEDVLLVTGCGFDAVESVSVAIACAMRHLDDPHAGLLEAINCGGDTDTVAAMCGAILGAKNGLEGWPEEWRNFRPEYATTLDLGARLLEAAKNAE